MKGPLEGLLVLDMTRVLAGPYCTMILSDLGARIIKIEPPGGDDSREFGPFIKNTSAYFASGGKNPCILRLQNQTFFFLCDECKGRDYRTLSNLAFFFGLL